MIHQSLAAAAVVAALIGLAPAYADDTVAPVTPAGRPHHVFLVGMLRVTQPWIDVSQTAADDAPAYLIVENRSAIPDYLTGASLEGVAAVAIAGDATSKGLVIPPNSKVLLQADAAHLVLHGIHGLTARSAPVPGTLRFERSGMLHLQFDTDRAQAMQDDQGAPDRPVDLAK